MVHMEHPEHGGSLRTMVLVAMIIDGVPENNKHRYKVMHSIRND